MSSITFNIGFIPQNWDSNEDGGDLIQIGDSNFNKLAPEICIRFNNELSVCDKAGLTSLKLTDLKDADSNSLKCLKAVILEDYGVSIPEDDLACCVRVIVDGSDEWEESDFIRFITEDGPEISSAQSYLGHLYFHAYNNDEEKDRVISWGGCALESNEEDEEGEDENLDSVEKKLVLIDAGLNKMTVVKSLRNGLNISIAEALTMVDHVPMTILNSGSDKWETLKAELERAGAKIKIE